MLSAQTVYLFSFMIAVFGAYGLGMMQAGRPGERWPWERMGPAAGLWLFVAVPTLLQLTVWPGLEGLLGRNGEEILHHGQLWRLVTAVMVQDGGVRGALFNLLTLALLAPVTVRLCGARVAVIAFAVGALEGELAGLVWQPIGAGNSVGNCGLAAALLAHTFVSGEPRSLRWVAAAVACIGLLQLLGRDIHGAAFAVGLIVMSLFALRRAHRT